MKNTKISETIFKDNRFYVRVEFEDGSKKLMPRANYVWLKHNQSFLEIPKAYVIHHLDNDKTNDDPTNVVLMLKFHHTAYHWKHKDVNSEVHIKMILPRSRDRIEFFLISEPHISYKAHRNKYQLGFQENHGPQAKRIRIYSYKGRRFMTQEDAEWAKAQIWPQSNQNKCHLCKGRGYTEMMRKAD